MEPTEWGWILKDGKLLPVLTDKAPAPGSLLKLIRCGCTTGCNTKVCTCRKHGLECTAMCAECKGTLCFNSSHIDESEEEGDEEWT